MSFNLSNNISNYWTKNKIYGMDQVKFNDYFFSFINIKLNKDIFKIYDIQDIDEIFEEKYINVILCVENCYYWHHYKHFNKYGNYGNKNIQIYLYNHITNFYITANFIVIPIIYLQIDYFKINYNIVYPSITTEFTNKKFCLQVSFIKVDNKYTDYINNNINKLKTIGAIDVISFYKNDINDCSLYHSEKLLNLFNKYKFILCFENSYTDGYITEKIFNAFFSRSIPIYLGPNNINKYINNSSYINLLNIDLTYINRLSNNEGEYNIFLKNEKVTMYDDEKYVIRSQEFIDNLLNNLNT
jgi:hypothetical protein